MHKDRAQEQSANPPGPFFLKNYSKFRAIDPAAGYKLQDQACGDEVPDNSQAGDGIRSS